MNTELTAVLCRTGTNEPLATVDGLPGGGADLTPAQLRALAAALNQIAADAEARPVKDKRFMNARREYRLAE
jgi:hypothetical protein